MLLCCFLLAGFLLSLFGYARSLEQDFLGDTTDCSITYLGANQPDSVNIQNPSTIDLTAHHEWRFDAVSFDSKSQVIIVFSDERNTGKPSGAITIELLSPSGSKISNTIFVKESKLYTCSGYIIGIWSSPEENAWFGFNVSSDVGTAVVKLRAPEVRGDFVLLATGLYPVETSSLAFAPQVSWFRAIVSGAVNATLQVDNISLNLSGIGGHDYYRTDSAWAQLSQDWIWLRLVAGPYSLTIWTFSSTVNDEIYRSTFLTRHNKFLFSSQEILKPSEPAYFTTVSMQNNDGACAIPCVNSTGVLVNIAELNDGRRWRFEMKHQPGSLKTEGETTSYLTQFADTVTGGENGARVHKGVGSSEQAFFTDPKLLKV